MDWRAAQRLQGSGNGQSHRNERILTDVLEGLGPMFRKGPLRRREVVAALKRRYPEKFKAKLQKEQMPGFVDYLVSEGWLRKDDAGKYHCEL